MGEVGKQVGQVSQNKTSAKMLCMMGLNLCEHKVVALVPLFETTIEKLSFSHSSYANQKCTKDFYQVLLVSFPYTRCKVHMCENRLVDNYSAAAHRFSEASIITFTVATNRLVLCSKIPYNLTLRSVLFTLP